MSYAIVGGVVVLTVVSAGFVAIALTAIRRARPEEVSSVLRELVPLVRAMLRRR
ncbi:hypothetical protein OIE69_43565 (plasmid) [Actinacidiphila glaucinigra]|uniref:hypothetical protein n=1 Tax=Actinacidiphila glaucinigra TaxID=235986 RepID=UPI002DDB6C44|nr:hypothetical protein [Actinacidiphila glaucinigra]WSD65788.1 hypothetical protein OIE69_43565 [Actinacidiphila glaucinigra]